MTNTIISILITLTTNWSDTGTSSRTLMWPPEINIETYHERATVHSNRIAMVEIEGKVHSVTLSSEVIGSGERSYTWEKRKVYSGESVRLHGKLTYLTNTFDGVLYILTNLPSWWAVPTNDGSQVIKPTPQPAVEPKKAI